MTAPGDDRGREPGATIRARAVTEAATMCCHGTGECGIGPDCGQDRARLDALNEAADWADNLAAPPAPGEVGHGTVSRRLRDRLWVALMMAIVDNGYSVTDEHVSHMLDAALRNHSRELAKAAPAETGERPCGTCQQSVPVAPALALEEHTWSIEDGPGSENPPMTCPGSWVVAEWTDDAPVPAVAAHAHTPGGA